RHAAADGVVETHGRGYLLPELVEMALDGGGARQLRGCWIVELYAADRSSVRARHRIQGEEFAVHAQIAEHLGEFVRTAHLPVDSSLPIRPEVGLGADIPREH